MIKRFKINTKNGLLKMILVDNKHLITNHFNKINKIYKLSCNAVGIKGYCYKKHKSIISIFDKNTILHELLHFFDYTYFYKLNTKVYYNIINKFFTEQEEEINDLYCVAGYDYLRYRLEITEVLSHRLAYIISSYLKKSDDIANNLKKLKNKYDLKSFEGIYLRCLAREGFFKILSIMYNKIEEMTK